MVCFWRLKLGSLGGSACFRGLWSLISHAKIQDSPRRYSEIVNLPINYSPLSEKLPEVDPQTDLN